MRGAGRVVFAATLLVIVGVLNIIYGFGALDDANIFVNDTRFILSNLNTLGWVLILLGIVQLTAGFSLYSGNAYGRVLGIVAGTLGAIGALFSIGGALPVVVTRDVRALHLRRPRDRRLRRGRAGGRRLSRCECGGLADPGSRASPVPHTGYGISTPLASFTVPFSG